jgi:hypothetical protein
MSLQFNRQISFSDINKNFQVTGGNMGIGTGSPSVKLHVVGGDIGVPYGQCIRTSPELASSWPSGTTKMIETGWNMNGFSGDVLSIYTPGSVSSTSKINLTSAGIINLNGNVGIGTASPSNRLQVYGGRIGIDDPNNAVLELKTNSYYSYIFTNASGNLEMYPGSSSNHIYLQPVGGKVAVGTASSNTPACALHIKGPGAGGTVRTYPSTYNSESSIGFYSGETSGSYWVAGKGSWGSGNDLSIGYSELNIPNMRFNTAGNIGIGTLFSPHVPLTIYRSTTNVNIALYSYFSSGASEPLTGNGSGTPPLSIYATGCIAAADLLAYSDLRIKTNVQDILDSSALETIRQIEPKRYKYIDTLKRTNETVWGFIAQQVGSVLENSTGKITDFVPNIFDKVSVSDLDGDTLLTLQNKMSVEFDISDNATRRIRLYKQDDTEVFVTLKTVVSSNSFTVEETLSESSYFAYGQEVKDFHTLNKDAIFTVAVAALQEVDRQLQQERQKVSSLQQQYQDLLARIVNLESN